MLINYNYLKKMDGFQYTSHKKLLIIGESGTGKSTFRKLLLNTQQSNEDLEETKTQETDCN